MALITYTFPADCPIKELAGVTVKGGKPINAGANGRCVEFATKVNGKAVMARIAGKPDLEAAVARYDAELEAEKQAKRAALESAVPGLAQYESAMSAFYNAQAAYEKASEYGYPAKEAAAADAADKALAAIHEQYPATVAYREIVSYRQASNDDKSSAGDKAMRVVEAGGDIFEVVAAMRAEWSAAAEKSVWNS